MNIPPTNSPPRKIIHIDMDCFYAAIEIRDNPKLANKPVAVGESADRRGVICTCNYIARKFGIHSAMATGAAYRLCPELILLPVNMTKYRESAQRIRAIFHEFTDLVQPLGLDEAYLDVTNSPHCYNSATWMAQQIRYKIWQTEKLIASAGVAPNKSLAKIASGWNKPNGFLVITPNEIGNFLTNLPVIALHGVGKSTAKKLHQLAIVTCNDLQQLPLLKLVHIFGKFGQYLYDQCRGIDNRKVNSNRIRKSISVEHTFPRDIPHLDACNEQILLLHHRLLGRIQRSAENLPIKTQYIKIKFFDFKVISTEISSHEANLPRYLTLLQDAYHKFNKPIRLIGLGVRFRITQSDSMFVQPSLFPAVDEDTDILNK